MIVNLCYVLVKDIEQTYVLWSLNNTFFYLNLLMEYMNKLFNNFICARNLTEPSNS